MAVGALVLAAALPVPVLEAAPDRPGAPRMVRAVVPGERFSLEYVHSVFGAPVEERFRVDTRLRLVLAEVRSTREEIVDYYAIPGARVSRRPGSVRIAGISLPHARLLIRATPIGARTLVAGRCRLPLTGVAGDFGVVTLSVRLEPAFAVVWNRGEDACPRRAGRPS